MQIPFSATNRLRPAIHAHPASHHRSFTLQPAPHVTNAFNVTMQEFVDEFSELVVLTFDQRTRRILMLQYEFRRRFVRCRIRRRIHYVWPRLYRVCICAFCPKRGPIIQVRLRLQYVARSTVVLEGVLQCII